MARGSGCPKWQYLWHPSTWYVLAACELSESAFTNDNCTKADSILKIVCGLKPVISTFGGPLRTGDHRNDGKYKYLGGAVGQDRKIYLFPSDCDYMLQIDPENDVCRRSRP